MRMVARAGVRARCLMVGDGNRRVGSRGIGWLIGGVWDGSSVEIDISHVNGPLREEATSIDREVIDFVDSFLRMLRLHNPTVNESQIEPTHQSKSSDDSSYSLTPPCQHASPSSS